MPGALEGLRVVDLTTGLAGPLATMMLSDHGADVVKVEPPGGDPQRSYVGSVVTNRGKRSVVLDLDDAADRDRLLELVDTADVLVESFAPGYLAARGLDYATVVGRAARARVLLAHRLPAHHRRRRPPRHRPARPGPLGHAVRAARLPRGPDLPARAAAEHRGVVPRGGGRPRRAVRARDHRPRAVGGDVALPGCARVHHAAVAGRRAPGRTVVRDRLRARGRASTSAPTACGCTRCTSPAVGARTAASSGRSSASIRPTSSGTRRGGQAFDDLVRDAIGRMKRQDLLDQFWANEIADRAGAARARGARGRAGRSTTACRSRSTTRCTAACARPASPSALHGAPTPSVQGPQPALGQHTDEVLGVARGDAAHARATRGPRSDR